jgi:heat shock protein HslJ
MIGIGSFAVAALLGAGCGSDDAGGSTDAAAVEGTIWMLQSLAGEAVPGGVEVTLEYDGERIAGTGGCNQYSGGATFDDGSVTIDSEIMGTRMACEDPAASVESSYLAALPRVTGFVVQDDMLLISADDEQLLSFVAAE